MKRRLIITICVMLSLSLVLPSYGTQAAGIIYYVDNTNAACNDLGIGTLPSQPFCTINRGAEKALAGDTVRVLAGSYAEKVKPRANGISGSPITFSAAGNVTVTGDGDPASGSAFRIFLFSYITVDGFNVTNTAADGIYVADSDHITISNNHVKYSGLPVAGLQRSGIYLSGTTNSTITHNITDHNSVDGIRLINGCSNNLVSDNVSFANAAVLSSTGIGINVRASSTFNTIIHNIVYANEDSGLNFYAGTDPSTGSGSNLIIGNVSYGNGDHGIDIHESPNNIVVGNTIQGNVTSGINLEGETINNVVYGSNGTTVINNIVADNGLMRQVGGGFVPGVKPGNIYVDAVSTNGTVMDYNLYYLTSAGTQLYWAGLPYLTVAIFNSTFPGQEANGLEGDPLFTTPAPIAMRPPAAPFNVAVNFGNYYIKTGSPAIDSANNGAPNEPALDILGRPRVDDPLTPNTGSPRRSFDDRGAYEFYRYTKKIMLPMIVR